LAKEPEAVDSDKSLEDHNICLLFEDFTNEAVKPVIEFILSKNLLPERKKPKHLTLIINSPGGEMPAAFALIDIMKGSSIPIHTLGIGQIASCGLLTFLAGEKGFRSITPNTSILSHQWSGGSGGKAHDLIAIQREYELTSQRMMNHYKRCTGMDEKSIKKYLLPAADVWMDADQAVKYGIADKIKLD